AVGDGDPQRRRSDALLSDARSARPGAGGGGAPAPEEIGPAGGRPGKSKGRPRGRPFFLLRPGSYGVMVTRTARVRFSVSVMSIVVVMRDASMPCRSIRYALTFSARSRASRS